MYKEADLFRERTIHYIRYMVKDFEKYMLKYADTIAVKTLNEIQKVIKDKSYSEIEQIEKIEHILEKYKNETESCNDL